jgi:hypothetical protein
MLIAISIFGERMMYRDMTSQINHIMEGAAPLVKDYIRQAIEKSLVNSHDNVLPSNEPVLSEELLESLLLGGTSSDGDKVGMVRDLIALLNPIVKEADMQEQYNARSR